MSEDPRIGYRRSPMTHDGAATALEPLVVVVDGPPVLSPGAAVVLTRIVRAYLARRQTSDRAATGPDLEIAGRMEGRSGA